MLYLTSPALPFSNVPSSYFLRIQRQCLVEKGDLRAFFAPDGQIANQHKLLGSPILKKSREETIQVREKYGFQELTKVTLRNLGLFESCQRFPANHQYQKQVPFQSLQRALVLRTPRCQAASLQAAETAYFCCLLLKRPVCGASAGQPQPTNTGVLRRKELFPTQNWILSPPGLGLCQTVVLFSFSTQNPMTQP